MEHHSSSEDLSIVAPLLAGVFVLVVEDDPDSRIMLATLLTLYGAQVTTVGSAREAREALDRVKPNILVSDIHMPGESGIALIRGIRALDPERGGTVPAIALTARASPGDQDAALAAGFQVYLNKPVDFDHLVDAINGLLHRPVA